MTDHLNDAADDRADPVTAQARDWVLRLASGDMVETDMAAFKTWLAAAPDHQAAFERERQFWHRLEALKGRPVSFHAVDDALDVVTLAIHSEYCTLPELSTLVQESLASLGWIEMLHFCCP